MRNLLIIAHEFPPSAGGGVQRISKIAQYLPQHGWMPTVLCARPVPGRPLDNTLLDEVSGLHVVRLPARHISTAVARAYAPFKRLRSATRAGKGVSDGATVTGSYTRTAMQIPMSTRVVRRWFLDSAAMWGRQVPAEALRLHKLTPFDAILASGPPPSALLAGRAAAELCGIPLIADFRDGWMTRADFRWPENPSKDAKSRAAEQSVLDKASLAIAVSEPIAEELREFGMHDVMVVANGFDPEDLPRHAPQAGPLRVGFMGRFYNVTDPSPFFDGAVIALRDEPACSDMRIDVVGPPSAIAMAMVADRGLEDVVTFHGFLPHAAALDVMASADVGLVAIADQPGADANYTGKLFEYLGVGLPVLLVGPPNGVAAQLIRRAAAGKVAPYTDPQAVADALGEFARAKRAGEPAGSPIASAIAPFDRRAQVAVLAAAFDELVSGPDRG